MTEAQALAIIAAILLGGNQSMSPAEAVSEADLLLDYAINRVNKREDKRS